MYWIEITVRCPVEGSDTIRQLLEARNLERMQELPHGKGWRGFVLWDMEAEKVPEQIRSEVKGAAKPKGSYRVSQKRIQWSPPSPGWILENPLDVYAPDNIGDRVVLVAPHHAYKAADHEVVVTLLPSRAFGNGAHQTTRLCTRALERFLKPGDRVIDVGTGTGVLACIAASLGASEVLAVDMEPLAAESARANVLQNGLEDKIRVECGEGLDGVNFGPVDLVMCNIMPWAIEAVTPDVMRHLRMGGIYLLSGVRDYQVKGLDFNLMSYGLNIVDVTLDSAWTCLVYRRDPLPQAPDLDAWRSTGAAC